MFDFLEEKILDLIWRKRRIKAGQVWISQQTGNALEIIEIKPGEWRGITKQLVYFKSADYDKVNETPAGTVHSQVISLFRSDLRSSSYSLSATREG